MSDCPGGYCDVCLRECVRDEYAESQARIRELEAQLAEAHGDLAKAREAWAKRGVSRGVVMLHEYDGAAQAMRDALRGPELRALKTVTPPTE